MKDQQLYRKLAKYYDKIYHEKDYEEEVQNIKTIIAKYKQSKGKTLLDVACGTGSHLQFLQEDFDCSGVDINELILEVAREKLPTIDFIQSDMAELSLNKKFDVILCLFSSIGYILTEEKNHSE